MYEKHIKRILDFIISLISLVILAIPMVIVALLVKFTSKGPIFFKQERIGKNGKVFKIYKFRTMVVGAEHMGTGVYSTDSDNRITKVGKFLRLTSIDELPQLINIIKGEMSIIGPRPVLTYHPWKYEEYTEEQLVRFKVRPGVTGLAQINGRKGLEWNKRLEYDKKYVDNMSFKQDIGIFIKTIGKVILAKDNVNTSITAQKKEKEAIR